MWKSCGSPLAKCKSKSVSLSLPHYLVFILGMAFCPQADSDQANVSYFAGGCFWCTDAVFEQARGVTSVVSGYMQGAETIQITFDPSKTSYDKLLNLFWRAHNPIEVDSQGPDTGKQYRSAIFYVDEQQHEQPKNRRNRHQNRSQNRSRLRSHATSFRRAPENHQNFCRKNPNTPYVRQIMQPKLQQLGLKKP
jgi:peptide-methionine (S)-S-oxide reductase